MNQPAREYMRGRALEGVALLQAGKPSASVALTPYELLSLLDAADDRDRLLADLAKAREERDEAEAALEYQRDAIKSAVDGENKARARLAALEARAADARMACEWVVSGFGVVATAAVLDANNRAHAAARRYLANAPAAPAKADEMWPQLIEAVELLREAAPDSWWTPNRDDWRARRAALLAAIDAGRARAT